MKILRVLIFFYIYIFSGEVKIVKNKISLGSKNNNNISIPEVLSYDVIKRSVLDPSEKK